TITSNCHQQLSPATLSPASPIMRASIAFVSALLSAIASAAPVPLNVGVDANVNLDLNLGGNSYRCVYFPAPVYKRSAEPLLGLNLGVGLDVDLSLGGNPYRCRRF